MFTVKLQGLPGLKAQLKNASEQLPVIVGGELETMAQEWVELAKKDAPKDFGGAGLEGAISWYKKAALNYEIVAQKIYAHFVEFGTKGKYRAIPGTEAIAAQMKGYKGGGDIFKAIKLWVARKNIGGSFTKSGGKSKSRESLAGIETAAFLIARSILRNGINPHPYFFKQMGIVWPRMLQRIVRRLNNAKQIGSGRPVIETV